MRHGRGNGHAPAVAAASWPAKPSRSSRVSSVPSRRVHLRQKGQQGAETSSRRRKLGQCKAGESWGNAGSAWQAGMDTGWEEDR